MVSLTTEKILKNAVVMGGQGRYRDKYTYYSM